MFWNATRILRAAESSTSTLSQTLSSIRGVRLSEILDAEAKSISQRVNFLDGLRGWGAVFVVLFHVFSDGFPTSDFAHDYLRRILPFNGQFAVYIFFIVSGFSLTIGYLNDADKRKLGALAATRYFRLALPIFFACAVVHIAQATGLLQPPEKRIPPWGIFVAFPQSILHLIRFSFFDVFFNYSLSITYIGPLWTMSIELVGSFIAIAAVWVATALNFRLPILAVTCVLMYISGSINFLFILGVVLADLYKRERIDACYPVIGILLFIVASLYMLAVPWSGARLDMLVACVLMLGSIIQPSIRSFLSTELSKHLGAISFPLYLVHGPVMLILGAPMMQHFGKDIASKTLVQLAIVALSFVSAYAFMPINCGFHKVPDKDFSKSRTEATADLDRIS